MMRSPNPDAYEPRLNPFMQIYEQEAPEPIRVKVGKIPDGEGLEQHSFRRYLDTASARRVSVGTASREKYFDEVDTAVRALREEWRNAWKHAEGEELVDDMDGYQQYAARANDIASKIASVNPGGMLYGLTRSPQNMLHSVFDIDRFWRYIDFMPGLLDDLDYLLDENAAPFVNSGKFLYPPMSTRMYHTNLYSGGIGWRAYVVRRFPSAGESGMNAIHPNTGELIEMPDLPDMHINIFRVSDERAPLWHCVYSKDVYRFSLGFKLDDVDIYRLLVHTGIAAPDSSLEDISGEWNKNMKSKWKRLTKRRSLSENSIYHLVE